MGVWSTSAGGISRVALGFIICSEKWHVQFGDGTKGCGLYGHQGSLWPGLAFLHLAVSQQLLPHPSKPQGFL